MLIFLLLAEFLFMFLKIQVELFLQSTITIYVITAGMPCIPSLSGTLQTELYVYSLFDNSLGPLELLFLKSC